MLLGEETPVWGGVVARFRDIDGNSFSLVSFDELTHAMEAQRRAIAEKQEAERRAAHELEIAKHVQSRLFPQTLPPLATLEYAGVCIQARQVGGDYYDFLDLGQNRLGFVIADISGKGIAAALLMANLQANLRSLCTIAHQQPDHLLCSVNQLFCENTTDGAFATLFFAEYDDATRLLRYANCGHLPALLLRGDDTMRLDATATVLGIFKKWDCEVCECHLAPGDPWPSTPTASPNPSIPITKNSASRASSILCAAIAPSHRALRSPPWSTKSSTSALKSNMTTSP
jgi:hypothetical protein